MARVHRRSLLIAAGAFPATLLGAEVAQTSAVRRIGYLAADFGGNLRLFEAFVQGLRDLGRVEGRDFAIERQRSQRRRWECDCSSSKRARLRRSTGPSSK